jgi:hypothetical protein
LSPWRVERLRIQIAALEADGGATGAAPVMYSSDADEAGQVSAAAMTIPELLGPVGLRREADGKPNSIAASHGVRVFTEFHDLHLCRQPSGCPRPTRPPRSSA